MDAVFFFFLFISCKAGCKDPVWNEPVNLASLWDKSATGWYLYRLAALDPSMWAEPRERKRMEIKKRCTLGLLNIVLSVLRWQVLFWQHIQAFQMFNRFCYWRPILNCDTFTDAATQATVLVTDCPSPRVLKSMKNSVIFIQLEWMI